MSNNHFEHLIQQCKDLPAATTTVVYPCEHHALEAALEAAKMGLINPILVGPQAQIKEIAEKNNLDLTDATIVDVPNSRAAAQRSVEMVREGKASMMLKGSLHTDELLSAVASSSTGLRTSRRLSHVFAMNVPSYHKAFFITDAVVNIAPNLEQKADICSNAIDLLQMLGVQTPKLAILSAIETINSKIPSTLDAAALVMMSQRGQITGGVLDGPLAFDNAISAQAARIKGIKSQVAGDPDVLVVPNLEAGNMLAKQLIYLSNAQAAGVVLGASAPIALTSRSDAVPVRIASCVICVLMAAAQQKARKA